MSVDSGIDHSDDDDQSTTSEDLFFHAPLPNNNNHPLNTQQGEKNNLLRQSPRKPRNMKNLSLDLSTPSSAQPGNDSKTTFDRPPTLFRARTGSNSTPFRHPSLSIHHHNNNKDFEKPPPTLQRRRTTLAITIPSNQNQHSNTNMKSAVPRSDSFSKSPILVSSIISNKDSQQSLSHSINNLNINDDSFRVGAYQNGPICVLEPNLYLYSEPTLDQIKNFDIVINVAKELKDYTETIANDTHIKTNYIFIPWTHTSQISHDFQRLVSIIEDGLSNNSKILIHCQCGVSRSASLIVAFIMKSKHLNLNDAYNELKLKAPLISPNMTLIFQLMEWNNHLTGANTQVNSNVSTPTSTVGGSSSNTLNPFVSSPTLPEVIH